MTFAVFTGFSGQNFFCSDSLRQFYADWIHTDKGHFSSLFLFHFPHNMVCHFKRVMPQKFLEGFRQHSVLKTSCNKGVTESMWRKICKFQFTFGTAFIDMADYCLNCRYNGAFAHRCSHSGIKK